LIRSISRFGFFLIAGSAFYFDARKSVFFPDALTARRAERLGKVSMGRSRVISGYLVLLSKSGMVNVARANVLPGRETGPAREVTPLLAFFIKSCARLDGTRLCVKCAPKTRRLPAHAGMNLLQSLNDQNQGIAFECGYYPCHSDFFKFSCIK